MKRIFYIVLTLFLIPLVTDAQKWKYERHALYAGIGTNHFMGDLGGGGKDAAHFLGVRDMDFSSTRPTSQFGYRYRIIEELSVKANVTYAFLKGDDKFSASLGRQARNLHFHSNIWELGGQIEYYFIKEKEATRYTFSSLRGINKMGAYLLIGGGGLYYNPKAEMNGTWHSLRKLHTEGQTMPAYPDPDTGESITPDPEYGMFAGFFSVGLGAKFNLNNIWSIGIEISNRYTTTDYLDDAHNRYYNWLDNGGTIEQIYFSDQHLLRDDDSDTVLDIFAPRYPTGTERRGDPNYNDAYILTVITVYYKMKTSMKSRPKWVN